MRAIALFCLILAVAAPGLARDPLSVEDVGRFVAAAEEMTDGGLAVTLGGPLPMAGAEVARRHGVSVERWDVLSRRIRVAFAAQQMVAAADARYPRAKLAADGLSTGERQQMSAIVQATRTDIAFTIAETEADRAAIAPWLDRLRLLAGE